ncbi:MAG: hypothetical protein MJZ77_04050 [Bacteroidales bacterium]|nr:hypothetical protein [Bacteroidales bacterium]
MRKTFITIALFAVLGGLTVSCQKENLIDETTVMAENETCHVVNYTIDGETYHLTLVGEDAWQDFLNYMLDLTEEGHEVSFRNEEAAQNIVSAKETVTHTTTNREEAYSWAKDMEHNGYDVIVQYDKKTKTYKCTAIK